MRLLIELPLTIAFFTLAVKYGWPYTVVFVLGYILAFNFKLHFISRRIRVRPRFLTLFLTMGLSMRKLVGVILSREEVQKVIASNVRLKPLIAGFRQGLALQKRWRGYLARTRGSWSSRQSYSRLPSDGSRSLPTQSVSFLIPFYQTPRRTS